MSTVFYRKWRPVRFSDVVGQRHITDTLRRAVISDRVAHAYIFTGPRGVGKTSTARILAKALNTERDEFGDPLADTPAAIAIDEGRYMDLIEIDAASNRGIDDIRALRDRVLLRPTEGRFKVYIIDEVHMLTDAAFNALLKTLEEPPPQVVMILATTDIHRVPPTIISRCQRFDFRRLSADDVVGRLIEICDVEEIECEPEVLELIARSAWGSLRDAENLLEQVAISYGGGGAEITEEQARELLGIGDAAAAKELAEAILTKDAKRALEVIESEASRGSDISGLREGALGVLRSALLSKHGVSSEYSEAAGDFGLGSAETGASADEMMQAIDVMSRIDRYSDSASPLSLEVASLQAIAASSSRQATAVTVQSDESPPARLPRSTASTTGSRSTAPTADTPAPGVDRRWHALLDEIEATTNSRVRGIFVQVSPLGPEDGVLTLKPKYEITTRRLLEIWRNDESRRNLRPAFQKIYGDEIRVQLSQSASPTVPNASRPRETPIPQPAPPMQKQKREPKPHAGDSPQTSQPSRSESIPREIERDSTLQMLRSVGARVISVDDAGP